MDLAALKVKKAEYDEVMKHHGKVALTTELKRLFDQHPEVVAVRWRQYTPTFNDGDPCVFSAYVAGARLDSDKGDIDDHEWDEHYSHPFSEAVREIVEDEDNYDVLEHAFGDGMEVTVHRDGRVDLDEYVDD